jgi:hypothetical protein
VSESDKYETINDLRARMLRVEGAVADMGAQMQTSVATVSKEVSAFIREIDRRTIDAKTEESDWKMQHATAVAHCAAKGETANEAKKIALAAKSIAEKAYAASIGVTPKGHARTNKVAWGGLIVALTGLLGAIATWLQANPNGHP